MKKDNAEWFVKVFKADKIKMRERRDKGNFEIIFPNISLETDVDMILKNLERAILNIGNFHTKEDLKFIIYYTVEKRALRIY